MEGGQKGMRPNLKRGYEGNRLEEQIWALAYEQVWPLICRSPHECRPIPQTEPYPSLSSSISAARRA
jgi:hypothetical protein